MKKQFITTHLFLRLLPVVVHGAGFFLFYFYSGSGSHPLEMYTTCLLMCGAAVLSGIGMWDAFLPESSRSAVKAICFLELAAYSLLFSSVAAPDYSKYLLPLSCALLTGVPSILNAAVQPFLRKTRFSILTGFLSSALSAAGSVLAALTIRYSFFALGASSECLISTFAACAAFFLTGLNCAVSGVKKIRLRALLLAVPLLFAAAGVFICILNNRHSYFIYLFPAAVPCFVYFADFICFYPDVTFWPDLVRNSIYPLQYVDCQGEVIYESASCIPLSTLHKAAVLSSGARQSMPISAERELRSVAISNGYVMSQADLHDRKILETSLRKSEDIISRCQALTNNEGALRLQLSDMEAQKEGVLAESCQLRKELLVIQNDVSIISGSYTTAGKSALYHAAMKLMLQREIHQAKLSGNPISLSAYYQTLFCYLRYAGRYNLRCKMLHIARGSITCEAYCALLIDQVNLLETAYDRHWNDIEFHIRNDEKMVRCVCSIKGADPESTAELAASAAVLQAGGVSESGIASGRCNVSYSVPYLAGGDEDA